MNASEYDLNTPKGRAKAAARVMDDAVRIPVIGYRVGIDPLLTALPIAGDVVAALVSLYVVFEGWRAGAGPLAVGLMSAIAAADVAVGFVPVVGPLLDAVWKANSWNAWIIERAT